MFYDNVYVEIEGRKQYLRQPLFLNKNNKRKKLMFYENWCAVGFRQLKYILYEVKPGFLPTQAIIDSLEEREDIENKEQIDEQYTKFKLALPENWIKVIEENKKLIRDNLMIVLLRCFIPVCLRLFLSNLKQ